MQGGGAGNQGGCGLVQLVAPGRSEVIADGRVDERMGEGDKGIWATPVFCQQARRVCFVEGGERVRDTGQGGRGR